MAKRKKKNSFLIPAVILIVLILIVCAFIIRAAVSSPAGRTASEKISAVQTTAAPVPFRTPAPLAVSKETPEPLPTDTPEPSQTPVPTPHAVHTPVPSDTPEPVKNSLNIEAQEEDPGFSAPYAILAARDRNLVTVYTLDEAGCYSVFVKSMPASLPSESVLADGLYFTNDQQRWLTTYPDNRFVQYSTRIQGAVHIHSVPYHKASPDQMDLAAYQALGNGESTSGIALLCADAKWIYANCAEGTPVIVTGGSDSAAPADAVFVPGIAQKNKGWDPTDDSAKNPFKAKIPAAAYPTPFPDAKAAENPYLFG